jgi:hypothetical protein
VATILEIAQMSDNTYQSSQSLFLNTKPPFQSSLGESFKAVPRSVLRKRRLTGHKEIAHTLGKT